MCKKIIIVAMVLFQACIFFGCGKSQNTALSIPEDSQYIVIYSDTAQPNGGFYYVNENGSIIGTSQTLKMQDLICFDVSQDRIIISGERKNNTLILNKGCANIDGNFLFLNNSSYSGLTAVKSSNDSLLGIMNGNFSDDGYLNLLVLQSLEGQIIQELPIEIFAHSVIEVGEHTLVAGIFISNDANNQPWCAEIYDCFLETATSYKYEQYNCFWDILEHESSLVCIAENKNNNKNTIVSLDQDTFEVRSEIIVSDQLSSLFVYDNLMYAIGDLGIYQINFDSREATSVMSFDNSLRENGAYVNFAYFLGDKAYVFLRYSDRKQTQESYEYGNIVQVHLDSFNYDATKISHPKRDGLNNIFIVPTSFLIG